MNKLEFIGHLGKKPESRFTPSGQQVTSFSVGVTEQYTNKSGEKVKSTIWYRVQAWGKQAEICDKYLDKGSKVYIEGRLMFDKETGSPVMWDKKDGSKGCAFDVNLKSIEFLSKSEGIPASVAQDNSAVDENEFSF